MKTLRKFHSVLISLKKDEKQEEITSSSEMFFSSCNCVEITVLYSQDFSLPFTKQHRQDMLGNM